jgi:hypothetical protein
MVEADGMQQTGEAALPDAADSGSRSEAPPVRTPLRRLAAVGGAIAMLLWATWATHVLLDLQHRTPRLVKVQLADIVRDYVQAEARSGASSDQITAQTAQFLKTLNDAVSAHAHGGEIVLLSNAVVSGDVSDITDAVRAQVYAKLSAPQTGQSQGISPPAQTLLQPNGGSSGNGK